MDLEDIPNALWRRQSADAAPRRPAAKIFAAKPYADEADGVIRATGKSGSSEACTVTVKSP